MKPETYATLQAEIDRLAAARDRAFMRGMVLGCALTIAGSALDYLLQG